MASWSDWQGTAPEIAQKHLEAAQAAMNTGVATSVKLAGVEATYDPKQVNIGETIKTLQYYLWKIENGWDWQKRINPYAMKVRRVEMRHPC